MTCRACSHPARAPNDCGHTYGQGDSCVCNGIAYDEKCGACGFEYGDHPISDLCPQSVVNGRVKLRSPYTRFIRCAPPRRP